MEYKTIIDTEGNIIDLCVMFRNDKANYFEMAENYVAVDMLNKDFIKPKWTGVEWTEGATQDEIKEWEEANKPVEKEPSETEILQKQLLETQNMLLELQYKLTNKDLEIK
ncbi:hypothetical protein DVW05_10020 [Clostridium botulinum]|nr:hypothetical protein [Clostridium botulinum]